MKTPNNTAWAAFLAKIDGNTGFRSAISGGGGGNDYSHAHALHTSTNISFTISQINITDDVQHLVTASYDPTTGIISVYVDGVRRATRDADGEIVGNLSPLVLGNERPDGSAGNYNGLVDDVKIYSYALTREEVADEYQAVIPGAQCIYPDFIGVEYDVNDNCIIDLPDFAAIAEIWLATGLYTAP